MPTYVYKDLETGEIYEFKQSMRDDAYTHHPETGAPVKRLVSAPAIAFKGSGFYATDSRAAQNKGGTQAKAAAPAKAEASGSESKGGEAVPAKDTPAKVAPSKSVAPKGGKA